MATSDMQGALSFNVSFGGDMSESRRSTRYLIGKCKRFSAEFAWTGDGVGALTIEGTNSATAASGAVLPASQVAAFVAAKPAGVAGSVFLDGIETDAAYIDFVYTRASAGTDGVLTCTVTLK